MSLRIARIGILAATVLLTLLVVPISAPAQANDNGPVSICAVTGAVAVDATTALPPGAAVPGTYTSFDVAMICAGGLTGEAGAASSGSTGPGPVASGGCGAPAFAVPATFGQFCG